MVHTIRGNRNGRHIEPTQQTTTVQSSGSRTGYGGGGANYEVNVEVDPSAAVEAAGGAASTASEMAYNAACAFAEIAANCL